MVERSYLKKWGWAATTYALADGDILKQDLIDNKTMHEVLIWLALGADFAKVQKDRMK